MGHEYEHKPCGNGLVLAPSVPPRTQLAFASQRIVTTYVYATLASHFVRVSTGERRASVELVSYKALHCLPTLIVITSTHAILIAHYVGVFYCLPAHTSGYIEFRQ